MLSIFHYFRNCDSHFFLFKVENRFSATTTINHFSPGKCPKLAQLEFAFRVLESRIRSCLLKSVSALSLASHAPPAAPSETCQQYKWWARQPRGVARRQLTVIEINSLHFLLSAWLIKKRSEEPKPARNSGGTVGLSGWRQVGLQWGLGLAAAFEATRWQCHLATTLLALMTAPQGVPLEEILAAKRTSCWPSPAKVSPLSWGITGPSWDPEPEPAPEPEQDPLPSNCCPASTCDYYHQFSGERVSDDCSSERKPKRQRFYLPSLFCLGLLLGLLAFCFFPARWVAAVPSKVEVHYRKNMF